jgi:hypothetical protein
MLDTGQARKRANEVEKEHKSDNKAVGGNGLVLMLQRRFSGKVGKNWISRLEAGSPQDVSSDIFGCLKHAGKPKFTDNEPGYLTGDEKNNSNK